MAFFEQLPDDTKRFAMIHARRIIDLVAAAPADVDRLELLLTETVRAHPVEYGWAGAIEHGGLRLPTEDMSTRSCGEDAIKNFVLLMALGVPATYVTFSDWGGTGEGHDAVIVHDGDRTYYVTNDVWEPVRFDGRSLESLARAGHRYRFGRVEQLGPESFLDYFATVSRPESLDEPLGRSQILYHGADAFGELIATAKIEDEPRRVVFGYTYAEATGTGFEVDNIFGAEEHPVVGSLRLALLNNSGTGILYVTDITTKHWPEPEKFPSLITRQVVRFEYLRLVREGGYTSGDAERSAWVQLRKDRLREDPTAEAARQELAMRKTYHGGSPALAERYVDFRLFQESRDDADQERYAEIADIVIGEELFNGIFTQAVISSYLQPAARSVLASPCVPAAKALLTRRLGYPEESDPFDALRRIASDDQSWDNAPGIDLVLGYS